MAGRRQAAKNPIQQLRDHPVFDGSVQLMVRAGKTSAPTMYAALERGDLQDGKIVLRLCEVVEPHNYQARWRLARELLAMPREGEDGI